MSKICWSCLGKGDFLNPCKVCGKRMGYPVIVCGDQLEFEEEHKNSPPEERPDWPLPSFDARDWAKAFCKLNPGADEELMQTWFANALMRGYDEAMSRVQQP